VGADDSVVELNIYAINDFHGAVKSGVQSVDAYEAGDYTTQGHILINVPGAAVVAGAIKQFKQTQDNVMFVSAGDNRQGNFTNASEQAFAKGLIAAGLQCGTVGNHDLKFDDGDGGDDEVFNAQQAEKPYTSTGFYGAKVGLDAKTGVLAKNDGRNYGLSSNFKRKGVADADQPFGDACVVPTAAGVKVAFVGATVGHEGGSVDLGELDSSDNYKVATKPQTIEQFYDNWVMKRYDIESNYVKPVEKVADKLKSDKAADVVVALVHDGSYGKDLDEVVNERRLEMCRYNKEYDRGNIGATLDKKCKDKDVKTRSFDTPLRELIQSKDANIDSLITAHTHYAYNYTYTTGVLNNGQIEQKTRGIVQGRAGGLDLSHTKIKFDKTQGKVQSIETELVPMMSADGKPLYQPDATVQRVVDHPNSYILPKDGNKPDYPVKK
jgi:2',3'-cyclic-nucleotide 2'-phosphodiesterase (5'-nucleotidase family)